MATNKKHILTLLALTITGSTIHARWFDLDDMFESMEHQMRRMRQEMREMQQAVEEAYSTQRYDITKEKPQANIESNENETVITVQNIANDSIDASINEEDETLEVTTADTKVNVKLHNKFLSLAISQEQQKTIGEDTQKIQHASYRSSSITQTVPNEIQLSATRIDYDEKGQTLTIVLPYVQETNKTKKIPVNIKSAVIK